MQTAEQKKKDLGDHTLISVISKIWNFLKYLLASVWMILVIALGFIIHPILGWVIVIGSILKYANDEYTD